MASRSESKHTYKLYYFDIAGAAEPLRFLFAYGGIEYEDVRIPRDGWPALKSSMPMGQVPVLEVDGKRLHQSIAIARYLAKLVKLDGATPWEDLQIDIVVDTINDLRQKMASVAYEPEGETKDKKLLTLQKETIPFYMEKLEKLAKDNNGHFALGKLTWADLYFTAILNGLNFVSKLNLVENYPALKGLVNSVNSLDKIKAWIKKRPVSEY